MQIVLTMIDEDYQYSYQCSLHSMIDANVLACMHPGLSAGKSEVTEADTQVRKYKFLPMFK